MLRPPEAGVGDVDVALLLPRSDVDLGSVHDLDLAFGDRILGECGGILAHEGSRGLARYAADLLSLCVDGEFHGGNGVSVIQIR